MPPVFTPTPTPEPFTINAAATCSDVFELVWDTTPDDQYRVYVYITVEQQNGQLRDVDAGSGSFGAVPPYTRPLPGGTLYVEWSVDVRVRDGLPAIDPGTPSVGHSAEGRCEARGEA